MHRFLVNVRLAKNKIKPIGGHEKQHITITFNILRSKAFKTYDNIHEKKHLRSIGFTKKNIYDQ